MSEKVVREVREAQAYAASLGTNFGEHTVTAIENLFLAEQLLHKTDPHNPHPLLQPFLDGLRGKTASS